ncbi:MAG: 16S rRNA (cytosine(1402)-N(4))-methyltransferase, partial [Chloroflexota bacterium]
DCVCPPRQPVCTCDHRATLREISRKISRPTEDEIARNPRARSARLRVAESIADRTAA